MIPYAVRWGARRLGTASYRGTCLFSSPISRVTTRISRVTTLGLCCLLLTCDRNDPNGTTPSEVQLTLQSRYSLDIDEPSGLALNATGTYLWVVGNNPERIYRISLDGQVQERLDFKGEDLEGIACDPSDATLWVVEEQRREVLHLDVTGAVLSRWQLDLEGAPNNGLEGICLDSSGTVYVLNEKDPSLFIALDGDLSIEKKYELDFAEDVSGLDCNGGQGRFWVLSHQSRMLYLWSPEVGVTGAHPLPVDKAEGVALDPASSLIYIVSESEDRLYVYSIEFPE